MKAGISALRMSSLYHFQSPCASCKNEIETERYYFKFLRQNWKHVTKDVMCFSCILETELH